MFYLTQLIRLVSKAKLLSFIFILSSISLFTLSLNIPKFQTLAQNFFEKEKAPYFNALVSSDAQINSIARKIRSFPSVSSVVVRQKMSAGQVIQKHTFGKSEAILKNLKNMSYRLIKVSLVSGASEKTRTLVKDYLNRSLPKSSVTLSNIRRYKKAKHFWSQYLKYLPYYTLFILFVFWFFVTRLIASKTSQMSYIMEKFQRRSKISFKSFSIFMILLAVCVLITQSLLFSVSVFSLIAFSFMFLLVLSSLSINFDKAYNRY